MKTYIVTKLFYIEDELVQWDKNYYEQYERMLELCHLSCKKFMPHCEIKHFQKNVDNIITGFRETYYYIRDLWYSEECNILHLDTDVLLFKTLELSSLTDFYLWMCNSGVRYYPSTMSKESWQVGDFGFKHFHNHWNYEEKVYLTMAVFDQQTDINVLTLWDQHTKEHYEELYNMDVFAEDIHACHYLSTHHPVKRLQLIEHHAKQLGLI